MTTEHSKPKTALEKYNERKIDKHEHNPLERLRTFCCYAMNDKDWYDAESFFAVIQGVMDEIYPSEYYIQHVIFREFIPIEKMDGEECPNLVGRGMLRWRKKDWGDAKELLRKIADEVNHA